MENKIITSSRKFVIRDINALLFAPISRMSSGPQSRDDEGRRGFTLIELLVVVLIIGILAAVAVPQYQKSVERSRMAEAVQTLGDLATAQSVFYMQHNTFATGWDDLQTGDIKISNPSATGKWTVTVSGDDDGATMEATRNAGMYNTGKLTLTVAPSGAIQKICGDPVNVTGFCDLATGAGYLYLSLDPNTDTGTETKI